MQKSAVPKFESLSKCFNIYLIPTKSQSALQSPKLESKVSKSFWDHWSLGFQILLRSKSHRNFILNSNETQKFDIKNIYYSTCNPFISTFSVGGLNFSYAKNIVLQNNNYPNLSFCSRPSDVHTEEQNIEEREAADDVAMASGAEISEGLMNFRIKCFG